MMRAPAVRISLVAGVLTCWAATGSHADRIQLRGGGEVKGLVVPDTTHPQEIMVQTEAGSKPVAFQKSQVVKVYREPGPLDDYFLRRDQVEAKAEDQYEFGLWCEQNKLSGLAQVHYQRAVDLDKTFGPAHKKLGHVLHNDAWVTYDELREAQGMVKHKGKWISRQQQDQLASKAAQTAGQSSWVRRIRVLHRNLIAGNQSERADAEQKLADIRDPAAISGLIKILGNDIEAMRARLAHILGAIPGPEAQAALVEQILAEPDASVRQVALDELTRRKESDTTARLVRNLRSPDPEVIGRAAWALAGLGASSAVPKLIPALFQMERKTFMAAPADGGGSLSASFGSQIGGGVGGGGGGGSGMFGRSTAIPVLTGPVVAPGVVAFGATSVPLYSGASIDGGGAMTGGGLGGSGADNRSAVHNVTIAHPNHEVLAALERLTGRNFGFDVVAWRRWLATEFRIENKPSRRAPQP